MNGHSTNTLSVSALTTIGLLIASLVKGFSPETTLHLAGSSAGRIILHMLCFRKDHRFLWHWQGIRREFSSILPPNYIRRFDDPLHSRLRHITRPRGLAF